MYVTLSWKKQINFKAQPLMFLDLARKKQINFKAQPLMFLDLASRIKSLHSTLEQYLQKTERNLPSLVSILNSFANGHFLKVVIDKVSFLPSGIIFSSGSWRNRKNYVPCKLIYNKLEKYLALSISKNIYFIYKKFRFFNGK